MRGLIHLYCGDGKGKTTAATGLALRSAGAGRRVIFTQFFKDGSSSEVKALRAVPGVTVRVCDMQHGFFRDMDDEGRQKAVADYTALFESAAAEAADGADLLVLDEAVSACNHGMIPMDALLRFLREKPEGLEVVLTGRDPAPELLAAADYVTEMRKIRHPYDRGIRARKGVEF